MTLEMALHILTPPNREVIQPFITPHDLDTTIHETFEMRKIEMLAYGVGYINNVSNKATYTRDQHSVASYDLYDRILKAFKEDKASAVFIMSVLETHGILLGWGQEKKPALL